MKVEVLKFDITKEVPEIIGGLIYDLGNDEQRKHYIDDITTICEHVGYQIKISEED